MTLLTNPAAIRKTLGTIKPHCIAVAYVGDQWEDYVAAEGLKEIIVSPTFGSNPRAIRQLMQKLGDDKVHFLDTLHAKIYLGTKGALVGSCNLSQNGIGDGGREEAAIHVTDGKTLRSLDAAWRRLKDMAQRQYQTARAKKTAIDKLERQWRIAIERGLTVDRTRAPSLTDYDLDTENHRIHVVWYYGGTPRYELDTIRRAIPEIGKNFDEYCSDSLSFLENDKIKEGDWVLGWNAYRNGKPNIQGGDIGWMYVHHVVCGGAREGDETKLAMEATPLKKPKVPFSLNSATKRAIWRVLQERTFPVLHPYKNNRWELAPADAVVSEFLAAAKEKLREGARKRKGTRDKKASQRQTKRGAKGRRR